jgi:uncharacterized membrane protein SirB2
MTPHGLGTAVIIAALLVAAWCLVTAFRDRPIRVAQLVAMAAVQALVIAQIVVAVVHLSRGERSPEQATFIGYLCAFFVILPIAGVLARLEPTRWGAVVAGVGGLVVAILIVRLNQVWTGIG